MSWMVITYSNISKVKLPAFIIPKGSWDKIDGLLLLDDMVVDDTNMPGATLGIRRMQSPMKDLLPIKKSVANIVGIMKQPPCNFIDSAGTTFIYNKTRFCKIKYLKIRKVEPKQGMACIIWVKGIKTPFTLLRPPQPGRVWAGVLYLGDFPWLVYEFSEYHKETIRKKI